MRRTDIGFLGAVLLLALTTGPRVAAQGTATPPTSASPTAAVAFVLLTTEQVPAGLVTIQEGTRTLEDVASGFDDPEAAMGQFQAWGWQGNVIQAFHLPEGATADPAQIDGIYLSVHRFESAASAAAALDYTFEAHAAASELDEVEVPELADASRALYGTLPYGNEITLYVQQGDTLIRLSAASPEGNPTEEAIALMETLLDAQPGGTT
jgi:hypothetical protein